jgi:quercetin dioxygenase-like cupin family protein
MLETIHHPSSRSYVPIVPGEKMSVLVPSAAVGNDYTILESICEPGAAVPQHVHDCDEIFYVAEGEMTFLVNGNLTTVGRFGVVFVRRGVAHAWKNRSKSDVRMLAVFTPGGIDEALKQFHGLSLAEIETLSALYGTRVTGPAIEG